MNQEHKPNTFLLVAVHPYLDFYKFAGRAARSTFWLHVVMAYIFSYAISTFCFLLFFDTAGFQDAIVYAETDPALMQSVFSDFFSMLLPTMAASMVAFIAMPSMLVKRMHDSGRTGWWAAPYLFVSVIGLGAAFFLIPQFFSAVSERNTQALEQVVVPVFALSVTSLVAFVIAVVFAVFKGDDGANRYGEKPFSAIN